MTKLAILTFLLLIFISFGSTFFIPGDSSSSGSDDDLGSLKYPSKSILETVFSGQGQQTDLGDLRYPTDSLISSFFSKAIGALAQVMSVFQGFDLGSVISPKVGQNLGFLNQLVRSMVGQSQGPTSRIDDDDFDADFDSIEVEVKSPSVKEQPVVDMETLSVFNAVSDEGSEEDIDARLESSTKIETTELKTTTTSSTESFSELETTTTPADEDTEKPIDSDDFSNELD